MVRTPNWLGDCIMALPVFRELRRKFPDSEIVAACRKNVADCFIASRYVDRVIAAPGKGAGFSEYLGSIRGLRAESFDIGVLTTNSFATALWLFLGGVKRRIGFARDGRRILLTDAFTPTLEILAAHQGEYYLHVLQALGITAELGLPELELSARSLQEAEQVLAGISLRGKEYAVIAPLSAFGGVKDWGNEKYGEVAGRLAAEFGLEVLLTGTAQQAEVIGGIVSGRERVHNMAGRLSLSGFMALLKGAKLYIGGDSGGAHTAAALGVPTITIFGITEPSRTKAIGKAVVVVGEGGVCTPDLKDPAVQRAAREALDAITPELIIQRARELLEFTAERGTDEAKNCD